MDAPLTDREMFDAYGTQLTRIASALDAIADALTVAAPQETGIDGQARDAARDRINLRSLRRNHPSPEDL